MKKTLLASAIALSIFANAQVKQGLTSPAAQTVGKSNKYTYNELKKTPSLAQKTTSITSNWFNFTDFIESVSPSPNTQIFSLMHIFPDSNVVLGFTSTSQPVYAYIHKAANYLDPSFIGISSIPNKTTPYTLDSVKFGYVYDRKSANSVTDSVIIEVIAENQSLNYTLSSGAFSYQDIEYNYLTNKLKPSMTILKRVAVPLKITDTAEGGLYKQIKIATPGIPLQTNSKKIGTVISFKPGYTWNLQDTLIGGSSKNVFFIYSSEMNGASTDPTFFGTVGDFTSNLNMSFLLSTDTRYNISASGWNGYLIPTYAYTTPYAYEAHDISYKLSVNGVGLNELEKNGFELSQNVPNPFSKNSTVSYNLIKDANNASFIITDVMGRIVSSEKTATSTGYHTIKVGSYAAGVYYYTLTIDGKSITKKMIVE